MVSLLLSTGADPARMDKFRRNAENLASARKHGKVLYVLKHPPPKEDFTAPPATPIKE